MRISSTFDGGNIDCLAQERPDDIRLRIRADEGGEFYQWFYFRLTGARDTDCVMNIVNAGGASYPKGWDGYRAVASYDRERWFRVPTSYQDSVLTIRHRPERPAVWYAYFAPYSMERHADLIARCQASPRISLSVLGPTLDGQDLDLLKVGADGAGKRVCWVIARQHPGETMAEWWMEGFLGRLLDETDELASALLGRAEFYVVPNMNPDGSRRGHLRTNAAGANLNREWQEPSLERSPEVYLVRQQMEQTGVDFCLDVHGDEALPYCFIAGSDGIPSLSEHQALLLTSYKDALRAANPDFQTEHGYPATSAGKANLKICTNWIAETFGCLAMTLEQPFKDAANAPDPAHGWSPDRCRALGRSSVDALCAVIDRLR